MIDTLLDVKGFWIPFVGAMLVYFWARAVLEHLREIRIQLMQLRVDGLSRNGR